MYRGVTGGGLTGVGGVTGAGAAILKFLPNKGGYLVGKVLHSAVANAVNNNDLDESKLYVKACWADEGITLKRFMPRAKGSASAIHKRTSHITVVVAEKE